MNNNHFPSLENCKKLKEIGFPNTELYLYDTRKSWKDYNCQFDNGIKKFIPFEGIEIGDSELEINTYIEDNHNMYNDSKPLIYPSVMEMLDVMSELNIIKDDDDGNYTVGCKDINVDYNTLPNALAEMIIWLHENKYLTFNK